MVPFFSIHFYSLITKITLANNLANEQRLVRKHGFSFH